LHSDFRFEIGQVKLRGRGGLVEQRERRDEHYHEAARAVIERNKHFAQGVGVNFEGED
jgi:hypothetical protein